MHVAPRLDVMTSRSTRRQVLLAGGSFALSRACGPTPAREPLPPGALGRVDALAERLRPVSRSEAPVVAAAALRAGASLETLLGAVLKIGVEDVRPRPHGILHTVMMVYSTLSLTDGAEPEEAELLALWNLDDLKVAQRRDRDEWDDWTLPRRPDVRAASASAGSAELIAAMEAWDVERADRAVVAWLPHVDHRTFFECLWPMAARCRAFIGHKIIHAAQLERALRQLPGPLLEPAARSLVRTLLVDRATDGWQASLEHARRRASTLGEPRAASAVRALELFRRLRRAEPGEPAPVALEALADGAAPEDLWNAARLVASEVFHDRLGRRSSRGRAALLPVHGLTVVEALGHAARTSRDPEVARACLFEALARLPEMRAWLIGTEVLDADGAPLEALGRDLDGTGDLERALASGSPGELRAHLERGATSSKSLRTALRGALISGAREHHQHKYLAALLGEAARAPAPLRPLLLAPSGEYVAHPDDGPTDVHERSLAALRA